MALALKLDEALHRAFGLPYLRLTRERSIHERCAYAMAVLDSLGLEHPAVLDVGCGSGILLRHLARYRRGVASYTGIDRAATRLLARYRDVDTPHRFVDIDLDSDWRMSGHNVAWCSEVLEHLFDDRGVLKRIAAGVTPGGHVIVTMPSLLFLQRMARHMPSLLNVSAAQDGGHVRAGYTAETLRALADNCGLAVVRIDAVSPRREFEIRNRYYGPPALMPVLDRIKFSGLPRFVLGANATALTRCLSIAAVLRAP